MNFTGKYEEKYQEPGIELRLQKALTVQEIQGHLVSKMVFWCITFERREINEFRLRHLNPDKK